MVRLTIYTFTEMEGFSTPACQTVTAVVGQTATVVGNYVQQANLRALSAPASQSTHNPGECFGSQPSRRDLAASSSITPP